MRTSRSAWARAHEHARKARARARMRASRSAWAHAHTSTRAKRAHAGTCASSRHVRACARAQRACLKRGGTHNVLPLAVDEEARGEDADVVLERARCHDAVEKAPVRREHRKGAEEPAVAERALVDGVGAEAADAIALAVAVAVEDARRRARDAAKRREGHAAKVAAGPVIAETRGACKVGVDEALAARAARLGQFGHTRTQRGHALRVGLLRIRPRRSIGAALHLAGVRAGAEGSEGLGAARGQDRGAEGRVLELAPALQRRAIPVGRLHEVGALGDEQQDDGQVVIGGSNRDAGVVVG